MLSVTGESSDWHWSAFQHDMFREIPRVIIICNFSSSVNYPSKAGEKQQSYKQGTVVRSLQATRRKAPSSTACLLQGTLQVTAVQCCALVPVWCQSLPVQFSFPPTGPSLHFSAAASPHHRNKQDTQASSRRGVGNSHATAVAAGSTRNPKAWPFPVLATTV